MITTRVETDSFGPLDVPSDKYWGAQTQRSLINFPIGWEKQPIAIVRALGVIKQGCAMANTALGKLPEDKGKAIQEAASEVAKGLLDDHFPLVVWQTGSGTQSNMNANEVIASLSKWFAGQIWFSSHRDWTLGPLDLSLPDPGSLDPLSLSFSALAALFLLWRKWDILWTLPLMALLSVGVSTF